MSQNTAALRLENQTELKAHLLNKAKRDGILILTVVFWDIKGFSKLCDILKTDTTSLVPFLKEFFDITREIIFEYGGVSDKYMGDGVMALFGFQSKAQDCSTENAICAVGAALELRERFKDLQAKWIDIWEKHVPNKITIGLKCGINTGYAIVGNIGTKKRAQFTAVGTTVNIASRLADICDSGQIIVSTTTKSKISNQFELKSLGTLTDLKNIHGPFEIFTVLKQFSAEKFTFAAVTQRYTAQINNS
jgi:adenylate cyclase